jgi:hypothetical protein
MIVLSKITKAKLVVVVALAAAVLVTVALFANSLHTNPGVTPQPTTSASPTHAVTATPSPQPSSPLPTAAVSATPSASTSPSTSIPSPTPSGSTNPTIRPPVPPGGPVFPTPKPPIQLYPGEIREYQGQTLASIGEVYENNIAGIQYLNPENYTMTVYGLVNKTLRLSYDDVLAGRQMYQKVVTIYCVEGWNATILWEGILVEDLIREAGPQAAANTVIFHASDGYTTALPLNYITGNNIMLAYKMNGYILPPERGFPFELVAESKYGYKWIKWITAIELSNDPNYLGYWESRGYSNSANAP